MKIAYLVPGVLDEKTGVTQKIQSHKKIWEENKNCVKVFELKPKESGNATSITKYIRLWQISRKVEYKIRKFEPDVVYSRYLRYIPGIKRILGIAPNIFEINSDDTKQAWLSGFFKGLYNALTRDLLLDRADGFVFVTKELRDNPNFSKFKKKSIIIANGINIIYDNEESDKYDKGSVAFIGTPDKLWHGIEKVIYLAKKLSSFDFHIIGYDNEKLFDIDKTFNTGNNVIAHGFLNKKESNKILSKCHVGVGTLSLYVKNMNEACPLKVRQYIANGLPVIIGYYDVDLSNQKCSYIMQIENSPNNVMNNLSNIEKFLNRCTKYKARDVKKELLPLVDSAIKERKRLNFFQDILNYQKK